MKSLILFDPESGKEFFIPCNDYMYCKGITDPIYAKKLIRNAKKTKNYLGARKEAYASSSKQGEIKPMTKHISAWTYDESIKLIEIMSDYLKELKHPAQQKNVFNQVAYKLINKGFAVTSIVVRNKWKSLMKSYRKNRNKIMRTGSSESRFIFFNAINDLFGKKTICQFDSDIGIHHKNTTDCIITENQVKSDDDECEEKNKSGTDNFEVIGNNQPVKIKCVTDDIHVWNYDKTLKFIEVMSNYPAYLHHPTKKQTVFELVANDLKDEGFTVDAITVRKKWKSIMKSYRQTKNKKRKTGNTHSSFMFFNEIDVLMQHKPIEEKGRNDVCLDKKNSEIETIDTASVEVKSGTDNHQANTIDYVMTEEEKGEDDVDQDEENSETETVDSFASVEINFATDNYPGNTIHSVMTKNEEKSEDDIGQDKENSESDTVETIMSVEMKSAADNRQENTIESVMTDDKEKSGVDIGQDEENSEITTVDTVSVGTKSATDNVHGWHYDKSSKLIQVMSNYLEELKDPKLRNIVFKKVSLHLIREGFAVDPIAVQNKWKFLMKSYRKVKNRKIRTGSTESRFIFFNEIDAIFRQKLSSQFDHSETETFDSTVSVGIKSATDNHQENSIDSVMTEDEEKSEDDLDEDGDNSETETFDSTVSVEIKSATDNHQENSIDSVMTEDEEKSEDDLDEDGKNSETGTFDSTVSVEIKSATDNQENSIDSVMTEDEEKSEDDLDEDKENSETGTFDSTVSVEIKSATDNQENSSDSVMTEDEEKSEDDLDEDGENPETESVDSTTLVEIKSSIDKHQEIIIDSVMTEEEEKTEDGIDPDEENSETETVHSTESVDIKLAADNRQENTSDSVMTEDEEKSEDDLDEDKENSETETVDNLASVEINSVTDTIHVWDYDKSFKLIMAMSNYLEELKNPILRNIVFEEVSLQFIKEGFAVDPIAVRNKWKSFMKSYRKSRNKKIRTGSTESRFIFFNEIDCIFRQKESFQFDDLEDFNTNACQENSNVHAMTDDELKSKDDIGQGKDISHQENCVEFVIIEGELETNLKTKADDIGQGKDISHQENSVEFVIIEGELETNLKTKADDIGQGKDISHQENSVEFVIIEGELETNLKTKADDIGQGKDISHQENTVEFVIIEGELEKNLKTKAVEGSSETKSTSGNIHVWNYDNSSKLIEAMSYYLEDQNHPTRRQNLFELVANDLKKNEGFAVDTISVHKQWKYFLKSYKKDKRKMETGGTQSFIFFNEINDILGQKPTHQFDYLEGSDIGSHDENTTDNVMGDSKRKHEGDMCKEKGDPSKGEDLEDCNKSKIIISETKDLHIWDYGESSKPIEAILNYFKKQKPENRKKALELFAKVLNIEYSVDSCTVQNNSQTKINKHMNNSIPQHDQFNSNELNIDTLTEIFNDFIMKDNKEKADGAKTETVNNLLPIKSATKNIHIWSHDQTCKLIQIFSNYSEDLKYPEKRNKVFDLVAKDLNSEGLEVGAINVQNKWKSLVKRYRRLKETDSELFQFKYFDEMDDLLGEYPINNLLDHPLNSDVCGVGTIDTADFVKEQGEKDKSADEIHSDKQYVGKERTSEMELSGDYLRMKKEEYTKRQQRHGEIMELGKRLLKITEELMNKFKE